MAVIPFTKDEQLYRKPSQDHDRVSPPDDGPVIIPGYVHLAISNLETQAFLNEDLLTPRTDRLYKYLWLVGKQDSSHISSITEQAVRGRRSIITEDPELHLVWYYDRVYVKPLPKYLLSYDFWNAAFASDQSPFHDEAEREQALRAARGFLRSYAFLIRRKSDFALAIEQRLLPRTLTWSDFVAFAAICQRNICDNDVTPRYHYGELRLTRLNFWSRASLQGFTFKKVHHQYSDEIARFYGPLLFVFAVFSTVLSAMQVTLNARQFLGPGSFTTTFSHASQVLSLVTLCAVAAAIVSIGLAIAIPLLRELVYALGDLARRGRTRAQPEDAGEKAG